MANKSVPENVVVEILLKLPVKSLLRFRCVCKGWRLLLDSQYFISKHLEYSRKNNSNFVLVIQLMENERSTFSLVSEETLDIVTTEIDIIPVPHVGVDLFGPINGVVSVCGTDQGVFFCNPSTREFKALPPYINGNYYSPELVVTNCAHGFGFDEKSNDYKFVRIIKQKELTKDDEYEYEYEYDDDDDYTHLDMKVEIYSLGSDCWRKLDNLKLPSAGFQDAPRGYFNGACHWFVEYYDEEGGRTIMYFRMDTEVFEQVPLPRRVCLESNNPRATIFVLDNKYLSLILYDSYKADGIYDVWVMREYGVKESWSKDYRVGPLPIPKLFSPDIHYIYPDFIPSPFPVSVGGNANELLLSGWKGEFVLCDIHDTEKIRVLKAYQGNKSVIRLAFYMESLVSVKRASDAA